MSESPPPVRFAFRGRPFAAETTLELREADFVAAQALKQFTVPYGDVKMIRLFFAPRGIAFTGYKAKIYTKGGRTIALQDRTWKSLFETEYPRAAYRAFLLALCERTQAANPKVQFHAGISVFRLLIAAVMGAVTTVLLGYIAVRGGLAGQYWTALGVLAFSAGFGWWSWQYVLRNRPRSFSADGVPEAVLPGKNEA